MALAASSLKESPQDGLTRARYARMLVNFSLGRLARAEIKRALKDAPDEPLVLMNLW